MTTPRPLRFFLFRAAYAGMLFILMWTAWQSLIGWQDIRDVGIMARFGQFLYLGFALVEMSLMLFFAPLAAATAVAQEKDRRTFLLLLMTDLKDVEIVLGKLAASFLLVATMLATSAPVFFLSMLLGGISAIQLGEVLSVTLAAGFVGGSLGLLIALWRDRTFQSVSLTILAVMLTIACVEGIGLLLPNARVLGIPLVTSLNPYRNLLAILEPVPSDAPRPGPAFILMATLGGLALNAFSVYKLRVWNPGRNEPREQREGEASEAEAIYEVPEAEAGSVVPTSEVDRTAVMAGSTGLHVPRRTHRRVTRGPRKYRMPWTNPIIWRELMTRGYGTKPLLVKLGYVMAFAAAVALYYNLPTTTEESWRIAWVLGFVSLISLRLINTQGVTALTSERDSGALDLLLVTELSPAQFVLGKLYGALYNTKEMVVMPLALAVWLVARGEIDAEVGTFFIIDYLIWVHFAAVLGLHCAITYTNSRTAVAISQAVLYFLMGGIFICAGLIILSDREFGRQFLSFLIFIGAGSVALFLALGARNPSRAIALVAILTPFWTFYCIISMLNGDRFAAFLVSMVIYGYAIAAMLVPAVSDFDIALGRTNAIQG